VPLAYSRGFNPRPKLQLAAALPLGHTAEAELVDVWLERPLSVEPFAKTLARVLPDGLSISQVSQVLGKEAALPTQVVAAEYRATVEWGESVADVEARIERLLAAKELVSERRGRQYDLRPLVERLWLERVDSGVFVLGMQLAARQGATARPEAVLMALGMGVPFACYHRLRLIRVTGE
jgi:radical SAM-linked protein